MNSLLNKQRPLFFCPGCSHDRVVHAVDKAIQLLGLEGHQVAIVSDIGCSGLFDTFFNTHALHGLHGRALTYATGLKMVRPELTVLTVMGDGGLGIGGAHVLASCRRNLDISLLVLNNFNYGMTGGQCSATTPSTDHTASNFLNQLEVPLDICQVADSAGALYTEKVMATDNDLAYTIARGIEYPGFSLLDIWGICPGRHLKKNPTTIHQMKEKLKLTKSKYVNQDKENTYEKKNYNVRNEYGAHYRHLASKAKKHQPLPEIAVRFAPLITKRCGVLILGAAGQFISTIGEILSIAAMSCGLSVSQKNDYPITVLRGHSIAGVVLDKKPIGYTGIGNPTVILCVSREGVEKRRDIFATLNSDTLVLAVSELDLPETRARVILCDLEQRKVKKGQYGLAVLSRLSQLGVVLNPEMLKNAITICYSGKIRDEALQLVEQLTDECENVTG